MSAVPKDIDNRGAALTFLTELYAGIEDGWVTICHVDGGMVTDWFPINQLAAAAARATDLRQDVWFGIAPRRARLSDGYRGGVSDCSHLVALPLDIDVAGPGHKATEGLAATIADAKRAVEQFPVPPTVLIHSGGGLQAWWFLAEPIEVDDPEAMRALSCWADTWEAIGARMGIKVDNVFDVPRIMRLPGTANWKTGTPRPVQIIDVDYSRRFGIDDLEPYFLERPTPTPLPRRGSTYDGSERPGDWFNATADWTELLTSYGWQLDNRRNDGEEMWTRPGKDEGVSASLYYKGADVLKVFSDAAAPLVQHQTYDKFGFLAAMTRGGDIAQTTRDVRAMMANETTDVFKATTTGPRHLESVPTGGDVPPPNRPKRKIVVSARYLDELVNEIHGELAANNDPPSTFVRAGHPARIRADENGRPIIEQIDAEHLRIHAASVIEFRKSNKDGELLPAEPQLAHMRSVLAMRSWDFPGLVGITETPIMRPDATFRTEPGYDPATKLYHWSTSTYPEIPDAPTDEQFRVAVATVEDVLGDFPFDTTADRANAWALLLTGIVRPAITGQVPMGLLDAPEPGTGKSLLATIISLVTTGRHAAMTALPDRDEELEKRITALLMAGSTAVIFDNVEGTIKSHILAGALTADVWQGRVLGASQIVEVPSRVTWMATGNNIDVGGDLARRCYRIRLDAHTAQPWKRTEFRHTDLIGYVSSNREKIISALCTMVRSWVSAGKPKAAEGTPAMGGYRPWVELVGGILEHCGVTGFLANSDEFHSTADREAQGWEAFLTAWHSAWGNEPKRLAEMVTDMGDQYRPHCRTVVDALPDDLSHLWGTPNFTRRLGQAVSKRAGRHYGDAGMHVVKHEPDRMKILRFSVEPRVTPGFPAAGNSTTRTDSSNAGNAGNSQQPYVSESLPENGNGDDHKRSLHSPRYPRSSESPPRPRPFLDEEF